MKKLELKRQTIKELTAEDLRKVAGGLTLTCLCRTPECGPPHPSACDCSVTD